jgi:acyl-homoserine-lactone acylase
LLPLDELPQSLNPRGGYVHNENDPPHFANLKALLDTAKYPANVEKGSLDLRSQHALQLIGGTDKLSLEEVLRRKHSMRMLLADRVKPDLLAAISAAPSTPQLTQAAQLLTRWDNTVRIGSKGSTLFETWWRLYAAAARDSAFAEPWSWARLTATPRGLGKPDLAVRTLSAAIDTVTTRWGAMDIAWGDVHRVRRGDVDVPVGGCSGLYGCFRVLGYERAPDGKLVANTGDGWVLAVEFGAVRPRAYSVLAYGQSADPASPHHADQAAMFARGALKPVWWTEAEVKKHTVREYRP